jgi:uncharacterized membrane protein YeaQ/YmgE (transglycosylase-associated protein family)
MGMLLWILFGACAAWLVSAWMGAGAGKRVRTGAGLSVLTGALGAAAAGCVLSSQPGVDMAALWRVSTVFVGAVGLLVIASLSTGGRLR